MLSVTDTRPNKEELTEYIFSNIQDQKEVLAIKMAIRSSIIKRIKQHPGTLKHYAQIVGLGTRTIRSCTSREQIKDIRLETCFEVLSALGGEVQVMIGEESKTFTEKVDWIVLWNHQKQDVDLIVGMLRPILRRRLKTGGINIVKFAAELGLSRTTIYRFLGNNPRSTGTFISLLSIAHKLGYVIGVRYN